MRRTDPAREAGGTRKHHRVAAGTATAGAAAMALLLLASCADQPEPPRVDTERPAANTVEETVKEDLGKVHEALAKMLDEEPDLVTKAVTAGRLRAAGYVESPDVSLTLAVKKGSYCLYAVPRKADTMYGIDTENVWFIGSDEPGQRQAPVVDGRPAFPGDKLSEDYAGDPCVTIEDWRSI